MIVGIVITFLSSCKMQELYLNVVEPAPVTLPSYIKIAGVVDRSTPTDEMKKIDKLENVMTLEGGGKLEKDGTLSALSAMTSELMKNNRFDEIRTIPANRVKGPGIGMFPPPLDWDTVTTVCKENGVDALFSLELYDTDTKVSFQVKKSEGKTILGSLTGIETQADMLTTVKTGWRIYDPQGKVILDEAGITKDLLFSSSGLNPVAAARALTDRKEAVKQVSSNAGVTFAQRILPYEIRVYRDYYVKGTDNFKVAMRKARTGNWDEAAGLWMKETSSQKGKIAGRACYNMAIISEIKGSLDVAIDWARKSYEDYNNKQALDYINILKNRRAKSQLVNEQTEN